jgi:hypothetical protein
VNDFAPPVSSVPATLGRRETVDKITLMAVKNQHNGKRGTIRLTFSRNIIDGLLEYYDRTWHEAPFWKKHEYRYDYLFFQMAPFHKLLMPGALVRIHPRLLGAEGGRAIKVHRRGQRFFVQIVGRKLGFRPNVKTKQLDFAWAPYGFGGHGGLVLWFDDDDIKFPTHRQASRLPKDTDFIIR